MNKILYVARQAKGWSAHQLAEVLKISKAEYQEIENDLRDLDKCKAKILGKVFNVPPGYFFDSRTITIRQHLNVLEQIGHILNNCDLDDISKSAHISALSSGVKAVKVQQELKNAHERNLELETENAAIREMYLELKSQQRGSKPVW